MRSDTRTMKVRIMLGFFHAISRDGDGNHHHNLCGATWCVFKKASDEGKPLPSHDTMKNYLRLEKKYEDRVKEVFLDLSSPPLLERCLRGENQNQNEGLHSKLWLHQSRAKFAGLKRVIFATQVTIIEHNFGYEANKFKEHLEFSSTPNSVLAKQRMDRRKIAPQKAKG